MAQNIEVILRTVSIQENGEDDVTTAATLLTTTLTYPNTQTSSLSTVKSMKVKDNTIIDFAGGQNPDTNKPYTYEDRIVFKATLVGRTSLQVAAATVHKTSKLEQLLVSVFGSVFTAAWKLLVGGITNVLVGAAVEAVGAAHVDTFQVADEHSNPIGAGFIEFDENNLPASPVRIRLVATDNLSIDRFQFPIGGGQPQKVTVPILTKGADNGYVEFDVRAI